MRIAVALHMFNYELLEEYVTYLRNITCPYELFVTVPDDGALVTAAWPHVHLYPHQPNRGMDIGGFLTVLPDIFKGDYDLLLKLHSKSLVEWRRQLLDPICGSDDAVKRVLQVFSTDKEVGLVGADKWLITEGEYTRLANQAHLSVLTKRYNCRFLPSRFIGGTMFWVRVSVLSRLLADQNLQELHLELNTPTSCDWAWYAYEYPDLGSNGVVTPVQLHEHWERFGKSEGRYPNGLVARLARNTIFCDGMIEHAYERLFGIAVTHQGLKLVGL